ncbi:hypothetical protein OGATHE_005616 [Ogataea polymorpha]|uniref:Uncharacterized protein n=1 Tax=Ogataea polymorpha TaxID=460523 RepID=A0A9P8SZI7_9ASCO|nr:hypothetical protein OGATHE_005616 [Ogataea polymorpha]
MVRRNEPSDFFAYDWGGGEVWGGVREICFADEIKCSGFSIAISIAFSIILVHWNWSRSVSVCFLTAFLSGNKFVSTTVCTISARADSSSGSFESSGSPSDSSDSSGARTSTPESACSPGLTWSMASAMACVSSSSGLASSADSSRA